VHAQVVGFNPIHDIAECARSHSLSR